MQGRSDQLDWPAALPARCWASKGAADVAKTPVFLDIANRRDKLLDSLALVVHSA